MASKHKYKLIYFDIRARAEPVRMMMAMAGQEYVEENIRVQDWPDMKPKMPLGFMPVLETEEGKLSQSCAIWNLVATRLGFQCTSEWDKAQSEMLMITANELLGHIGGNILTFTVYKFAPEPEDLPARMEKCREEVKKKYNFFASIAKPGAKYLFGDKMTVADLVLYAVTDYNAVALPETRTVNDWVKGWLANMDADKKFANYIKNRRPSSYGT